LRRASEPGAILLKREHGIYGCADLGLRQAERRPFHLILVRILAHQIGPVGTKLRIWMRNTNKTVVPSLPD
jgi:hypothetical protein